MDPVNEAEIWLQATLSAHPGVTSVFADRIWSQPGPRKKSNQAITTYPICTYSLETPYLDTTVNGPDTFWSRLLFKVCGIAEGNDQQEIANGSAQIYSALHDKFGETDKAVISACVRDRPYKEVEIKNSSEYLHLGGEYLIYISAKNVFE